MDLCRICRNESDNLSINGIREGLPISVIIMVICPVKIKSADKLPKFICKECLEIILKAYLLRDESIESDRIFRNQIIEETEISVYDDFILDQPADVKRVKLTTEEEEKSFPKVENFESKTPSFIQGLTFQCPEENCDQEYKLKICLDIHLGLEHSGIADNPPEFNDFTVDTSQRENLKSMAWDYFGVLHNCDGRIVDDQHYYCRLCVGKGIYRSIYRKSSSTTTLLHHIRDHHLNVKKKRNRFENLELSSITHYKS